MRMSLRLSPKWLPSRGEIKRERTNLVAKVCTSSFTCDRPLLGRFLPLRLARFSSTEWPLSGKADVQICVLNNRYTNGRIAPGSSR